jgi:hypothetical protein
MIKGNGISAILSSRFFIVYLRNTFLTRPKFSKKNRNARGRTKVPLIYCINLNLHYELKHGIL